MRLIWLAVGIAAVGSTGLGQSSPPSTTAPPAGQSAGTGEMNANDLSRISLPPPKDVKAKQKGNGVVVEWAPSAQKRVTEYKVFRIDESDGTMTEVGRTKGTAFVVTKVDGTKAAFGVAAVDYRGNESSVSTPVKTEKHTAK